MELSAYDHQYSFIGVYAQSVLIAFLIIMITSVCKASMLPAMTVELTSERRQYGINRADINLLHISL